MPAIVHYNRDRRRSSFTRPMRDPEEILEGLRSLKAAKRELGRTMSLSGDKRRESREYGYVASLLASSFRLTIRSSVRPSARPSNRSFIRAIVCLSVRLSICLTVFHALVDLFLYIPSSLFLFFFSLSLSHTDTLTFFVSFSRCLSYFLTTTVLSLSIVGSSIGSIHPRSTRADRIFHVGQRRAYRTHANKCMCARTYMYPCREGQGKLN